MTVRMSDEALGKAIAEELFSAEGTAKAWDLKLEDAGEGWARASMVVREDMLNGHGTAHGGMIFALADTAFAWACNSHNVKTFAQHAAISFLSPAHSGERLEAEAREQSLNGRTGVYTVNVLGEDGRVVAIFQGLSRTAGGPVIETGE
jgi:acyl-CoA thioesterase